MNKKRFYWIIAFVVVCIFLFIYTMAGLIKENSRCIEEPFVYAARTIKLVTYDETIQPLCYCYAHEENGFYFDKNVMYQDNPRLVENIDLTN